MNILPIHTPIIQGGDDFSSILRANTEILDGDILVLSSKAVATAENVAMALFSFIPSVEAEEWAKETGLGVAFCQAVIQETARLHGRILGSAPKALLTEVKPDGLEQGVMLVPNAGLDQSNIEKGFVVGWPRDLVASAKKIHDEMPQKIAIIIGDSCVQPRRWGVTAFALVTCGINPLRSEIGQLDLFGKPLTITVEAIADQLSVAANTVMGNAAQSIPAAIIRDHGFSFSDFCGWVPGMKPEEDLFHDIL